MKKRRILLAALSLLLIAVFIIPGVVDRVQFEQTTKTYTAAVDMTRVARYFDREDLPDILKQYTDAGVTTVLIHEHRGTYPRYLLDLARDAGVHIALIPDITTWLEADLDNIASEYDVRYIKLQLGTLTTAPQAKGKIEFVSEMIEKHGLTLVLTEGGMQLGNLEPRGFDEIVEAANGNILRSYHSPYTTNVDVMDYPAIYYQVYISTLDRNCRFITVKQLEDAGYTDYENMQRTVENIRLYCDKMESHGFVVDGTADYTEYDEYESRHRFVPAATAAICVLWLTLMLDLLLRKSFTRLGIIVAVASFALSLVLPSSLTVYYPSLFAAFAPSFGVAVVAIYVHTLKSRMGAGALVASSVGITLALFCIIGAILCALLGGSEYFLNFKEFRGVKISLVVPIVFTSLLLIVSVVTTFFKKTEIKDYKNVILGALSRVRWYHFLLIAVIAVIVDIYILRSGNVNKISFMETTIRNWLTEVFVARPRTKEIILGWPCFVFYVYYVKTYRSKLLTWAFAIGASTLFASAANTFCHVFTMTETMYLRLFVGVLFGLTVGLAALGLWVLILRGIDKIQNKKSCPLD